MIRWDADVGSPVTLPMVKSFLGLAQDDYDSLLADLYIPAAVQWAEGVMRRSILSKTHYWTIDEFPCYGEGLQLPRGKTQAVTSVAYDTGGAVTTLRGPSSGSPIGTGYREDLGGDAGATLFPRYGEVWPSVDCYAPQPVLITFTAGWLAAQVPAQIKHALARYCGDALTVIGATDVAGDLNAKDALLMPWRLECA